MNVIKINADHPEPEKITLAVNALREGQIIAYLTDTIYGLGVDARLPGAIDQIYALKRRVTEKALPVIIGNRGMLAGWVKYVSPVAEKLMQDFWPGPLTLVFEATKRVPQNLIASSTTLAVRVPARALPRLLSEMLNAPIISTSANLAGQPGATTAEEVVRQFGSELPLLLDSGPACTTLASTILDVTTSPPRLLRAGALPQEAIMQSIGAIQT
ncbi:MAG: L-threonylcarbamoyladenylate synthase [candidate division KSB1 bacterium]|nr:L-threonylcarbamoyladenylate synthase [candidate division KSB1 bacterium]MDZ7275722.1 L-threonylcarbamoyladenylate synthase [candidate division KSB1 bacterium]MDZ7284587.1 L-threonylcarbamoyladenylate synthase [candidate division KSB1 bacterium]MDZ7297994.1 L-threonylcarbamoyladenylate synthase [candidate division KSB1 bacterium]MDZ7305838.1 L-threonylcarbamoyladenylate synthase [candidate division KSB1 bacterium]